MKKSTIAVGLTALALVLAACDGSSSTADAAQADTAPADAAQADATQEGPAQIGDTVHLGEADITTSNLRNAGADVFGDNQVCADVTVVNVSESDVVSLNPFDWKLTDTNGVMLSTEFGGATDYDSVELTPGGSKSGTLCFKSDAAPGEYTLTYEKSFSFTSKPTEWKGAL